MSTERRRFFRINDTLGLKMKTIPVDDELTRINDFFNNLQNYSARNEFNYQLAQHQSDFQHIENQMPELGRYLAIMQKQVDLLSEKLLPDHSSFDNLQQDVNLSAQGISIQAQEKRKIGELVELQLQLMPSKLQITSLARIIQCEAENSHSQIENKNERYLVSFDFEHIHDADQEILVKHIHSLQLRHLSEAQLERED